MCHRNDYDVGIDTLSLEYKEARERSGKKESSNYRLHRYRIRLEQRRRVGYIYIVVVKYLSHERNSNF